jgi:hypothetical protein
MKAISEKENIIETFPEGFEIDGVRLMLHISHDEISALLASYDPNDFNSPDIVTCRALARLILDALNSEQ